MNVDCSSVLLNGVCEGCLSSDRELKTVYNCEVKEYFQSIIEPLAGYSDDIQSNQPLALCWECTAIVKKTVNFRKQVQNAHSLLIEYMLHQTTTLPCLSNLTSHMIASKVEVKFDDDILKETLQPRRTEPLAFIKVEEDDDDFGADLEGYFVENDEGDVDDKDLKAVLKTDLLSHGDQKSKKQKNKKEDIEFDDSDDEPLKKRTEKKTEVEDEVELPEEYKPRGKRKKKDDGVKSKKRKGKREAPSGVVENARVARKLQRLGVPPGALHMLVLSWEQVEEERQKALSCALFTRHSYRCALCAVGFNHRFKLDNHMKKHDPSSGPLVCASCRIRCKDRGAMGAHRRRHRVRWRCSLCDELSSRAEVAADHYARAHGAAAPTHSCKLCGHTAPSLGKLRNHMKNHSERQKCELCGKSFRDRASLRTHLFIHGGEKEYACARCGKLFLFKKAMEVHLVTHDAPAHLYCHQCDVNFKNRMSYYQHMKYNLKHIDPAKLKYACPLCDKKFAKAARLREHNVAVHLKATPISCTMPGCTFACSSRPVLRTHIRMVHRNLRAVKNHVCHTCGKAYSTKKTLEGHMRSHTGERPFSCALCSSTFAYEAALYNHNKLVHLKAKTGRRAPPPRPAPALSAIEQPDLTLPR